MINAVLVARYSGDVVVTVGRKRWCGEFLFVMATPRVVVVFDENI
jgi:hypothetical protein